MTGPECPVHSWSIRTIELTTEGVWTEEVCRECGDERVIRPSARDRAAS